MRKIISKIAGLMLGLSLVIGAGVSLASHKSEETKAADVSDTITASDLAATGTSYTDFSSVSKSSDAVYAGNSAKSSAGAIQMRSKSSNSGIVSTTSGGTVKSVTITVQSGSNTIDVYGSNSAYSAASDLYGSSAGTKVGSTSSTGTITFSDSYSYVGIRSNNGAIYLTSVEIVWDNGEGGGGSEKTVTSLSITGSMTKTSYTTAESWSPAGFTVTATYDNDSSDTADVTSKAQWTYSPGSPSVSTTSVVATASYGGQTANSSAQLVTVSEAPGTTEDNPYTVAQARAAIDAGSGVTGVYATGIVSAIPTAYSTQYSDITFNLVDNSGDSTFLQAFRCTGTDAANVAVGDIAVVSGNLTKYSSTYEFAQGCTLVSLTHPTVETTFDVTFNANGGSESPAAKEVGEGLTFNFPSAGSVNNMLFKGWSSDGATFYQVGAQSPAVDADITYTAYWQSKGTASNPYSIAEAMDAIDGNYGLVDAHVSGIVSQVDSYSSQYHSIYYWISDDGLTTTQLECYSGKGLDGANFLAVEDVTVGYSVVVCGTLKKYNSTYEFDKNNYQVSYTAPATPEVVSIAITGSLTKTSYTTAESWSVAGLTVTATLDNSDTEDVTSSATWNFYNSSDVEKSSPAAFGDGQDQTLKIKATYGEFADTTTAIVTVEYVDFVGYSKVTDSSGLAIGDSYVIGVENTTKGCELMGSQGSSIRNRVDATDAFNNDKTLVTADAAETAGAVVVTLLSDNNGKYAFYDITSNEYIYGASTNSNQIYSAESLSGAGTNAWWEISFADGLMDVTLNGTSRVLAYNLSAPRFATYNSYGSGTTTGTSGNAHPVLFRMDGSDVKTSLSSFANNSLKMNDSSYEGDIETENCQANYESMKEAYIALSDAEKNVFQYSSDFSAARARLEKWAAANHEVFVYGAETPFAASSNYYASIKADTNSSTIVIVVVALTSITSICVLLVIKRKRALIK